MSNKYGRDQYDLAIIELANILVPGAPENYNAEERMNKADQFLCKHFPEPAKFEKSRELVIEIRDDRIINEGFTFSRCYSLTQDQAIALLDAAFAAIRRDERERNIRAGMEWYMNADPEADASCLRMVIEKSAIDALGNKEEEEGE